MIEVLENEKVRIDNYLSDKLDISRSKVQKLIKDGNVLVNGQSVNVSYKVKIGDVIEYSLDLNEDTDITPEDIPIDIVYEDADLLVINKASGMVVHPAPGHYTGTLVNALLYRFNLNSGEANLSDK